MGSIECVSEGVHDFDSPWKEALEDFLQPALELFQPHVAQAIDWSCPPVFLDKELQAIAPEAEHGRQYVDKLVQVTRKDGIAEEVLLHLENQSQPDPQLPLRMYRYHQRLLDLRGKPVASLAILADDDPLWRPGPYRTDLWNCRVHFEYLTCKLLDFPEEDLIQSNNPIAHFVLAHRIAQRTTRDSPDRCLAKYQWIRQLYQHGFDAEQARKLFRLMDWMTPLTLELDVDFRELLHQSNPHKAMPFVTSIERFAREEGLSEGILRGREQGREEGLSRGQMLALKESIQDLLEARFGVTPQAILDRMDGVSDLSTLRLWHRRAVTIESLEAFQGLLES